MTLPDRLAEAIDGLHPDRRVLIAFDGPDASGKTTLAEAVAGRLRRRTVRVSIDGWHNPRDIRLRSGAESPEGYYEDSFDPSALTARCLLPFRDGASAVSTAAYDYTTDKAVHRTETADATAALLMDGVFLLRPELRDHWTLAVYLHVPESVSLARALSRDVHLFGSNESVQRRYRRRYLPGQALYRDAAKPSEHADIVIDNTDPDAPVVLRWREQ